MSLRIKKFFAGVLIFVFCFGFIEPEAKAFLGFGDIVYDPINYVVNGLKLTAQFLTNFALGLPGSGAALRVSFKAAKAPCEQLTTAYQIANTADTFPSAEIIGANSLQITKLTVKITALNSIRNCLNAVLIAEAAPEAAAEIFSGLQGEEASIANEDDLKQAIRALDNRIDRLTELRTDAVKSMWVGVATRIFLTAQNKLVTSLINKMIAKYRIGNYLQYADALTTQVYNIEFAQKNYPNKMDQAILKSIGQQFSFNSYLSISPAIRAQARNNLGLNVGSMDLSDPNFFRSMSLVGAGPNDPYVLNAVYQSINDGLQAAGRNSAQMELAQNQGIMSLRNCGGIVQQELNFDRQWYDLAKEVDIKSATYDKLQAQATVDPKSVNQRELQLATEDLDAAYTKLASFPQANGNVYIKRCQDIMNPGASVSNFITSYLQSHLASANTADQKNLPFMAKFAETVADSFITRIIQHELNSPVSLTSGGFVNVAIQTNTVVPTTTDVKILQVAEDRSVKDSIVFTASLDVTAGQIVLNWDASTINGGAKIQIDGPQGFKYQSSYQNGSITIRAPAGSLFTLQVLSSDGTLLSSSSATAPSNTSTSFTAPSGGDQVQIISGLQNELKQDGVIQPPPTTTMVCGGIQMTKQACLQTNDAAYCDANCSEQAVLGAYTFSSQLNARGNPGYYSSLQIR